MTKSLAHSAGEDSAAVAIVSAQVLADRMGEIHDMIARRAYELYERRGGAHGRDFEDWIQAEDEIVHPCWHDIRESNEAVILRAEIPSWNRADQLNVSVEPRRLMVSGERDVQTISSEGRKTRTDLRKQRVFRLHELPVEVNPLNATAVLEKGTLTVTMPKVAVDKSRTIT
ncbi:MAG: DUF2934 domain-containing protein, partial [Edaphobacter sp.]